MLHIRAVASEIDEDRLAIFRVLSNLARQGEKLQGLFEIDARRLPAFRNGCAGRLLAFAALDIRSEAAGAQRDHLARIGVGAELLRTVARRIVGGIG